RHRSRHDADPAEAADCPGDQRRERTHARHPGHGHGVREALTMPISGKWKQSPRFASYRPDARGTARNSCVGVDPGHSDRTMPHGHTLPAPVTRLEIPPFIEDMFDVSRQPPAWPDYDTESGDMAGTRPVHMSLAQHDVPTLPRGVPDNDRLRRLSHAAHSAKRRMFPSQTATMVSRGFQDKIET